MPLCRCPGVGWTLACTVLLLLLLLAAACFCCVNYECTMDAISQTRAHGTCNGKAHHSTPSANGWTRLGMRAGCGSPQPRSTPARRPRRPRAGAPLPTRRHSPRRAGAAHGPAPPPPPPTTLAWVKVIARATGAMTQRILSPLNTCITPTIKRSIGDTHPIPRLDDVGAL